jgi:hypothetical protein
MRRMLSFDTSPRRERKLDDGMHAPPIALSVEALLVRCHYRWRTVTHTKAGGGLYHNTLSRCRLCMVQVELHFRVRLQPT